MSRVIGGRTARTWMGLLLMLPLIASCGQATMPPAPTGTPAQAAPTVSPTQPATPATAVPVEPGDIAPIRIDGTGYSKLSDGSDAVMFAAIVSNLNTNIAIYRPLIFADFYGPDEDFLSGEDVTVTLLPGQTSAIIGQSYGAANAVRMQMTPSDDPSVYLPYTEPGTMSVDEVDWEIRDGVLVVSGSITSGLGSDESNVEMVAVYRAADGSLLGGSDGAVESLPAGATAPFVIEEPLVPADLATVEVYWQIGGRLT